MFSIKKAINRGLAEKDCQQSELARHLGVLDSSLSNIKKNNSLRASALIKCADFFDVSLDVFRAWGETSPKK